MMNDAKIAYQKLIDACPEIELKGKNMLYTSSNGYMFSQLNKAGEIGIRLSKKDINLFSEKYEVLPFLSYGAKMREYVLIKESILKNDWNFAVELLKRSYDYVNTLPSK